MRTLLATLILISCIATCHAQTYGLTNSPLSEFGFGKPGAFPTLSTEDQQTNAVILEDTRGVYYFAPANVTFTREFAMHKLYHKRILVNNTKGLEDFNTVIIPMRGVEQIIRLEARVVKSNGEIINLPKSALKELKNVASGVNVKSFAIQGAAVGDVVEYFYVVKSNPEVSDKEVFQQKRAKVLQATFLVYSKRKFDFNYRGNNGFPIPQPFTHEGVEYAGKSVATNIAMMSDEEYSFSDLNMQAIEWYVVMPGLSFSWAKIAQNISSRLSAGTSAGPELRKILDQLLKVKTTEERVALLDVKLRQAVRVRANAPMQSVPDAFKNKYANAADLIKMYGMCLKTLHVPFQYVIVADRRRQKLSEDFPSYDNIASVLIYIVPTQKYICVDESEYSYGLIPDYYAPTTWVAFIPAVAVEPAVRFVQVPGADTTQNITRRTIHFSDNLLAQPKFTITHSFQGYTALQFRDIIANIPAEKHRLFLNTVASGGLENLTVEQLDTTGTGADATLQKRDLQIKATLNARNLIEEAGDDIILHMGNVMGTQTELHEKNKRMQPVDIRHPITYHYRIQVTIPTGYKLSNGQELVKQACVSDGKQGCTAAFVSSYKQDGNKLLVYIDEYYTRVHHPLTEYEAYKQVVNAAAQMQKTALVFTKEN